MEINRRSWLKTLLSGAAVAAVTGKAEEPKAEAVVPIVPVIKEIMVKEKLTVGEVDEILARKGLDPVTRMSLKNDLLDHGRMDLGVVGETWAVGPPSSFTSLNRGLLGQYYYTFYNKWSAEKFIEELKIGRDKETNKYVFLTWRGYPRERIRLWAPVFATLQEAEAYGRSLEIRELK